MKRSVQLTDDGPTPKRPSASPSVISGNSYSKPEPVHKFECHKEPSGETTSRESSREASRSRCTISTACSNPERICYGTLFEMPLQIREDPLLSSEYILASEPANKFIVLKHTFSGEFCWLKISDGKPFGCLSSRTSQNLKRITTFPCVQLDCVVSTSCLFKARTQWRRSGKSTQLLVDFNIYGHEHSASSVGDALAAAKLFLQEPSYDGRSAAYDNPQYLKLPDVAYMSLDRSAEPTPQASCPDHKEASSSEIETLLDHIPQSKFLRDTFTNDRIQTPLIKHQGEAVDFIHRRETGDLPPSLSLWRPHSSPSGFFCFKHSITGAKSSEMEDTIGGIIADDMGLGKTLSMLAAIVVSTRPALQYAYSSTRAPMEYWCDLTPSKCTLVIIPSALLLESWVEEIAKHVVPGTLSVHRFHGPGKAIALAQLLQHDVVLTTYASVAADFCRGRSTLHRIQWYRVVLDEAHFIRNPATQQFRAIHAIPAKIRWCLTGTPIQNSLEDLGALVKFLRVPILEDLAIFRKQITVPVVANVFGRFTNLTRLLEALCLRRTKTLLNLPEPVTHTDVLQLSADEKIKYHDFGERCRQAINIAISGHSMKKANQHVIQAILGMRLFCNNGEHALAKRINARELPFDPEEALSYLQASATSTCTRCGTEITAMYQEGDPSSGSLTICQHLMCGECLREYEHDLDNSLEDGRAKCPECEWPGERESFIIRPGKVTIEPTIIKNGQYPTKLLALLSNVKKQHVGEKCIIFSFWKMTLDIVAHMLDAHSMPYCRIHGQIPASKRSKILTEFEKSYHIQILLITLGTGAVGLNKLKVANHIHILEPQWNPSVESQAIGRVLRLGQEKSVTIIRYIMKETVEKAVQSRQLRKLQLARGGFGLVKDQDTSQRVDKIMDLLCPSFTETTDTGMTATMSTQLIKGMDGGTVPSCSANEQS